MVEHRDNDQLGTAIIESPNGLRLAVLNLGATIQALEVPTDRGLSNVVLSYPDLEGYLTDEYFVGATVDLRIQCLENLINNTIVRAASRAGPRRLARAG